MPMDRMVRTIYSICIVRDGDAYFTNDALSHDNNVNDLITFTVTFMLEWLLDGFTAASFILFHKRILFSIPF